MIKHHLRQKEYVFAYVFKGESIMAGEVGKSLQEAERANWKWGDAINSQDSYNETPPLNGPLSQPHANWGPSVQILEPLGDISVKLPQTS